MHARAPTPTFVLKESRNWLAPMIPSDPDSSNPAPGLHTHARKPILYVDCVFVWVIDPKQKEWKCQLFSATAEGAQQPPALDHFPRQPHQNWPRLVDWIRPTLFITRFHWDLRISTFGLKLQVAGISQQANRTETKVPKATSSALLSCPNFAPALSLTRSGWDQASKAGIQSHCCNAGLAVSVVTDGPLGLAIGLPLLAASRHPGGGLFPLPLLAQLPTVLVYYQLRFGDTSVTAFGFEFASVPLY